MKKLYIFFFSWFIPFIQRDRSIYYTEYFGSNNAMLLLFKNLVRPRRFLKKVAYGQVFPIPSWFSKARPCPAFTPSSESVEVYEKLKQDGVVLLPGRYKQIAEHLVAKLKLNEASFVSSDSYQVSGELFLRQVDNEVLGLMVDKLVLEVFAMYYGAQPYMRNPPAVSITRPPFDQKATQSTLMSCEKLNLGWHYDTVNLLQIAILLNDVSITDSHMQVARRDHKIHRNSVTTLDYYYSDEYMDMNYSEHIPCIGPIGTAYLFDSNGLHRLFAVKDSPRIMVKVEYSPGNDIYSKKLEFLPGVSLEGLSDFQREALQFHL
jgi:hypothetical protein